MIDDNSLRSLRKIIAFFAVEPFLLQRMPSMQSSQRLNSFDYKLLQPN